jgi:DNA (cytosine-5)-methyltransferase 1
MGKTGIVTSHLSKLYGTTIGSDEREPLHTITGGGNHIAEVRAFLIKYYGQGGQDQDCREPLHTIPSRDRIGLVTIRGEEYVITDIGMRMLEPHELYAGQGFPPDYIIAPDVWVKRGNKEVLRRMPKHAQVRMCGNSVPPPMSEALVRANVPSGSVIERELAA